MIGHQGQAPGQSKPPGPPPRTPTRRLIDPLRGSILDHRQGQWPLEPFILALDWEGPTRTSRGHGRPLPVQHPWTDCKGPRPLPWGPGERHSPGGFEGGALALPQPRCLP